MFTTAFQPVDNAPHPGYIVPATITTTITNGANETPTLCDIKILCTQSKKRSKRHIYLTFIESCPLSSTNEQPCIELLGKVNSPPILLNECISFEYFDQIKNDFQSFIYIYFQSYTISIYFSVEHFPRKSIIIKHLESMYQNRIEKKSEMNNCQQSQELPCLTSNELILHTFDVKLIPHKTIISRDHILIGPVRIYFTTTDLYIASINCNQTGLNTTITNQCPPKDQAILCIPYFTIKHYGNRSNIFLIELGKSNYGNGEIHMKCRSSALASTIHLLVSPVIEERPLAFSSAFQNQFLTNKRMEKSKNIHPPVQLTKDLTNHSLTDPSLLFLKKPSVESLSVNPTKLTEKKARSVVGFFRKLIKNPSSLQQAVSFDSNQDPLKQQIDILSSPHNKFFELNIEEKQSPNDQRRILLPNSQTTNDSPKLLTNKNDETILISALNTRETCLGTYIDMGPTINKSDQNQQEEMKDEEPIKEIKATAEIGVNTTISLPPHVRSAIIVGNSVHLIAEERAVFPIGQRSFTSPASVMQPFKAQLTGRTRIDANGTSTDIITCAPNSSSSFHHPTSASHSQQSLLLSYGIVTFNTNPSQDDQIERTSNGSTIDSRLNSDLSIMSISHPQQPSNIYSVDNLLSSSSNSHIFRTLSMPANNIGDSTSGQAQASHGSIIVFEENFIDQTTNYLLGPPPTLSDDSIKTTLPRLSSLNLTTSISRAHLIHINEEKVSSNDSYALTEPLALVDSSLPNASTILIKPLLPSDSSIHYTDLLLNISEEQQQMNSSEDIIDECNNFEEEKNERSSTILYTDIDFHQTQRRDRIAQFAALSKSDNQTPPFVL